MKGFFAVLNTCFSVVCCWDANTLCAEMVNVNNMLQRLSTDPAGDAVWALCWLVGSRGAALRDAVRTRPLWGRKWRRPLWGHPQWRDCVCVLAQHRSSKHTQSCECFPVVFTVTGRMKMHDGYSWMKAMCALVFILLADVYPPLLDFFHIIQLSTYLFFFNWANGGNQCVTGFVTSIVKKKTNRLC